MDLVSTGMITDDLDRDRSSSTSGSPASRGALLAVFAELLLPSCTLAIGHTQTTQLFGEDTPAPADNHR